MADLLNQLSGWLAALRDAYRSEMERDRQNMIQQYGWDPAGPPTPENFEAFLRTPYASLVMGMSGGVRTPSGLSYRIFTESDAGRFLAQHAIDPLLERLFGAMAKLNLPTIIGVADQAVPDAVARIASHISSALGGASYPLNSWRGMHYLFRPALDTRVREPVSIIALRDEDPSLIAHEAGHALETGLGMIRNIDWIQPLQAAYEAEVFDPSLTFPDQDLLRRIRDYRGEISQLARQTHNNRDNYNISSRLGELEVSSIVPQLYTLVNVQGRYPLSEEAKDLLRQAVEGMAVQAEKAVERGKLFPRPNLSGLADWLAAAYD